MTETLPEKRREEKSKEVATSPAPPKAAKKRKKRAADALWDAVVKVTNSDAKTSARYIGSVCRSLREADPPYTPSEVEALPAMLKARGFTLPLTLGTVEKYIGWIRNPPSMADNGMLGVLGEFVEDGHSGGEGGQP